MQVDACTRKNAFGTSGQVIESIMDDSRYGMNNVVFHTAPPIGGLSCQSCLYRLDYYGKSSSVSHLNADAQRHRECQDDQNPRSNGQQPTTAALALRVGFGYRPQQERPQISEIGETLCGQKEAIAAHHDGGNTASRKQEAHHQVGLGETRAA